MKVVAMLLFNSKDVIFFLQFSTSFGHTCNVKTLSLVAFSHTFKYRYMIG